MAWPMPPGQWNPGMPVPITPDLGGMGPYTPEQWAMMQQQNWQWAQWQQQYAQWQSQYGDKYAQQMQAMPNINLAPPLPPSNILPPAPPPPDKPPPPPHENDEPLYGAAKPAPVPAPVASQGLMSSQPNHTPVIQNRPVDADSHETQPSVNADALKKLAEEERVFDMQFKKWEEEIEKWKEENANHPDKDAYREYEQKFEACREQLLERRQQMKLKRARLLSNAPQINNNIKTNNEIIKVPPPQQHNQPINFNQSCLPPPPQKFQHKSESIPNYNNQNSGPGYHQYDKNPINCNDSYNDNNYNDNNYNDGKYNETNYNENNYDGSYNDDSYNDDNYNEDYNDQYGYDEENYQGDVDHSFLPSSTNTDGIPGLDLVPIDKTKATKQDVIDITDEPNEKSDKNSVITPDYSTISKGINNILGDEKIMNILSMVAGQKPPPINNTQTAIPSFDPSTEPPTSFLNNQYNKNENYIGQYSNRNASALDIKQNFNNFPHTLGTFSNTKFPAALPQITQEGYNERHDNRQPNMVQEQLVDRNYGTQYGNQNVPLRNVPQIPSSPQVPPRPLIPNLSQKSLNHSFNSGPDQRGIQEPKESFLPPKPKWDCEPLFAPSIIVEYEHKPLRLKAREFIEPVHMFEYNHKSKNDDLANKRNFEKEADEIFKPRRQDMNSDWFNYDRHSRDKRTRDDFRDEYQSSDRENNFYHRRHGDDRRHEVQDKGRRENPYRDREKDYDRVREPRERNIGRDYDRDRDYGRDREQGRDFDRRDKDPGYRDRDSIRDRERDRDRDVGRDKDYNRDRDFGRDRDNYIKDKFKDRKIDNRNRSHSTERDGRKRGLSKESDSSNISGTKKSKVMPSSAPVKPQHIVMIDDILEPPGREMRPAKIVIILRGLPGSGKSYLAKLIRDREAEYGGTVRIMSIDDYFMQEGEIEETDPSTGKIVKKPSLKYEYDEKLEETYINSLKRAFKRSLTDGYFTFLIYDAVNEQLKSYADIWNYARQNGFQVYICSMESDIQVCFKRNIHNRKLEDIEVLSSRFFPTPAHHIQLDPTTLLQSASITDVQMEDIDDVTMEDAQSTEVENSFTSKWEKMDDAAQLARLDGINKPLRPSQLSMEDYLQLDDWTPSKAKPGKKTVRWADIEERRKQEKMRAIGFVVGQTDWNRMTDPTMGSSALTQTKYIERVRRF